MKHLVLSFKNAVIHEHNKKSRDKMIINKKLVPRFEIEHREILLDTLYADTVSNVLHALAGEKPVPFNRKDNIIKRNEAIYELAKKAKVLITSPTFNIFDKKQHYSELMIFRKAVGNCWVKPTVSNKIILNNQDYYMEGSLYWEKLRKFFEPVLYDQFIILIDKLFNCNVRSNYTCIEAIEIINAKYLNNPNFKDFLDVCIKNGKTPFVRLVNGQKDGSISRLPNRTGTTIIKDISIVYKLSGIIYIPVDDYYINKLRNASGCATILEGGFVIIDGLLDNVSEYELLKYKSVVI